MHMKEHHHNGSMDLTLNYNIMLGESISRNSVFVPLKQNVQDHTYLWFVCKLVKQDSLEVGCVEEDDGTEVW